MKATNKNYEDLQNSLRDVCLLYSSFKNNKRRESFGRSMFERLKNNIDYSTLVDNQIIYKGAQWGGKWGNYYKAIYYGRGEFHYGEGFSNKQIFAY